MKRRAFAILFCTASLLVGAKAACAACSDSVPGWQEAVSCKHTLSSDFCRTDYLDITDGQIDNSQQCYLSETFRRWNAVAKNEPLTLTIFFHGGLVDRPNGLDAGRRLYSTYSSGGAVPYFFIYNVGPADSIVKGDRARGLLQLYDNRHTGVLNHIFRTSALTDSRFAAHREHGEVTRREDWLRDGMPPLALVGRFGLLAWAYMKQTIVDGLDLIQANRTLSPVPEESCGLFSNAERDVWPHLVRSRYDPQRAGARVFLCDLQDLINSRRAPTHIILIGHSTGAIYASELLRKAQRLWNKGAAKQQQLDLIFMAPAVTYGTFSQTLQEAGGRIRNLRIFTMDDSFEKANKVLASTLGDKLKPLARYYDRSLLYAVAGLFEPRTDEPLLGLSRYLQPSLLNDLACCTANKWDFDTISYVQSWLRWRFGPLESVFILSPSPPTAMAPYASCAIDHGPFPTEEETLSSVGLLIKLIANGENSWPAPRPGDVWSGPPTKCQH